jgi:hypothetical protein
VRLPTAVRVCCPSFLARLLFHLCIHLCFLPGCTRTHSCALTPVHFLYALSLCTHAVHSPWALTLGTHPVHSPCTLTLYTQSTRSLRSHCALTRLTLCTQPKHTVTYSAQSSEYEVCTHSCTPACTCPSLRVRARRCALMCEGCPPAAPTCASVARPPVLAPAARVLLGAVAATRLLCARHLCVSSVLSLRVYSHSARVHSYLFALTLCTHPVHHRSVHHAALCGLSLCVMCSHIVRLLTLHKL